MPDINAVRLIDADDRTILIRGRSPGFTTQPPQFTGGELIPLSVRALCCAWEQIRFEPRELLVRLFHDVYVAQEGLVFDREGGLLRASIHQHEAEMVQRAALSVRDAVAGVRPVRRLEQPFVLGKKRGAGNYGHWMIEMLPALHLVLSRLGDPRIGVLVHDGVAPSLATIMSETLRRLGINAARVQRSGLEPVWVRELILVEGMTAHGTYMSPLVRDCHDRLAHGVPGSGIERLFLQRGPGVGRQFQDAAHVGRLAAERGFAVVSSAGLGLDEQIALLRDARLIVGIMGAAMTNLIYAGAGARAALFAPAIMPDTFFWFIANLRGLQYREIRCAQAGSGEDWNLPLSLSFRAFRRALDTEIASL